MLFDILLLTSLIHGTHHTDAGKTVRVNPRGNETVLFFSIDDRTNRASSFRNILKIEGPLCDLIVFYHDNGKVVICLVELKGSDIKRAVEQIANARAHCEKALQTLPKELPAIVWKAYVYRHGASPKETKSLAKELEQEFGKGHSRISGESDFSNFLRA